MTTRKYLSPVSSFRNTKPEKVAFDLEIKKAKAAIRSERPPFCACCQLRDEPVDCSHNYPEKSFKWMAAEKENMTLLKRSCHRNWEENKLWNISISKKIIQWMWERALDEPDLFRRKQMQDHVRLKILKCSDFEEGGKLSEELYQICSPIIEP